MGGLERGLPCEVLGERDVGGVDARDQRRARGPKTVIQRRRLSAQCDLGQAADLVRQAVSSNPVASSARTGCAQIGHSSFMAVTIHHR